MALPIELQTQKIIACKFLDFLRQVIRKFDKLTFVAMSSSVKEKTTHPPAI